MSMKRFVSVVVVFAVLFVAVPVLAEDAWYTCTIDLVGVCAPWGGFTEGAYSFNLTDVNGAFTNVLIRYVEPNTKDATLSIFLTALATDRNVKIYGDPWATDTRERLKQVHIAP